MSDCIDTKVRRAMEDVRKDFYEFDSVHDLKFQRLVGIIERRHKLRQGDLGKSFSKYCVPSLKGFVQQCTKHIKKKKTHQKSHTK